PAHARTRTVDAGGDARWRARPRGDRRARLAPGWLIRLVDVVFDADHGEPRIIGVDDHPVGAGAMAIGDDRDVLHRYGIVDIAADHVEHPGMALDDNVAMPGEPAGRQIVVADRLAAAPHADQIA